MLEYTTAHFQTPLLQYELDEKLGSLANRKKFLSFLEERNAERHDPMLWKRTTGAIEIILSEIDAIKRTIFAVENCDKFYLDDFGKIVFEDDFIETMYQLWA